MVEHHVIVICCELIAFYQIVAECPITLYNRRYVDAAKGSDSNAGTIDAPLQTIAAGVAKAAAGGTVYVDS